MKIEFIKRDHLQEKPKPDVLSFGKYFSDYMFEMDYVEGKGWHNAKIKPYGPISLDPASMVLHYAQETFEGLKAYRNGDDVLLFRPYQNAKRMMTSNARLCMATIDEDMFVEALCALLKVEKDWIPEGAGTALYLRPFCFANEVALGVHAATSYKFMIVASPVGAYYEAGVNPVKIYVEDEYVRAVKGGTGDAKCGGNYAASIIAQQKAAQKGYTQVLWLDGVHRKYVEEVGTMNALFVIDNEIITAPLEGSVLPGITRDACMQLLSDWGYVVREEELAIDILMQYAKNGRLQEAFGTGTAAVISPIGELNYKGEIAIINNMTSGPITKRLYEILTGIQTGKLKDPHKWVMKVV
ncbi:MAG: branched-chain amino acid aminotransferase [Breznakia sp.]